MFLAGALCLFTAIAACGPSNSGLLVPTVTPEILTYSIDPASKVPPSLEEQIFDSDAVVRASLDSATAGVETVPNGEGVASTYRAVQELRFTVHEYLDGTGPAETLIVVRGKRTYLTQADARRAAETAVAARTKTWDGRQGVLFLNTLDPAYQPTGASGESGGESTAPAFALTVYNYDVENEWDYSINTLSRAWLPASTSGGATGQSSSTAGQTFITDVSTSPPSVISLADLRIKITEFEAMMTTGAGIAGFEECVAQKIGQERYRRAVPRTPFTRAASLYSGSATGNEVFRNSWNEGWADYHRFWLSGPDMSLFHASVSDDDRESANGFSQTISSARPLPAGTYSFQDHVQLSIDIPCNYVRDDEHVDWTVTVTAPAGTIHEAFFDPANDGAAVGFSTSAGVFKPTGLSVAGTVTTVTGLHWDDDSVKLALEPYASLAGHALDFIALDGTVSLYLNVSDAIADDAAKTLTWQVSSQPWQDWDLLMLRIYNVTDATCSGPAAPFGACPIAFSPTTYAFTVAENATVGHGAGSVSAAGGAVAYSIASGNDAGNFAIGRTTGEITVKAGLDYESVSSYRLTLEARRGGAPATATADITVTDVNEPPVFGSETYNFSVAEDTAVWSTVGRLKATDSDAGDTSGGTVFYHITAGNEAGKFGISTGSDGAVILVQGALDYETTSSYTLTVEARDGKAGGTSSVKVQISVTDVVGK